MIRCLIAFVIFAVPSDAQSIVTSGGNRSIVLSGSAAVIPPKPVGPSEADLLRLEVELLKSSLAAATAPKPISVVQKPAGPPKKAKAILRIKTIENYSPCRNMKADIAAGLFSEFEIEWDESPSQHGYPLIEFQQDGEWRYLVNRSTLENRGYNKSVLEDLKAISLSGVRADILVKQKKETRKVIQKTIQTTEVPGRWVTWKGFTYDMESFSACDAWNCGMCVYLGGKQAEYFSLKEQMKYQTMSMETPPHQEPTPDVTLNEMINLLQLTSSDVLADLGCGDGRVLIAAVQRYGCRGIGVEIDPVKADEARRCTADAGLSDCIEINPDEIGNALDFDPAAHGVTVITAYLYPDLLRQLLPKFQSRGVRIVATPFHQIPGLPMTQHGDVWIYTPDLGTKSTVRQSSTTMSESRQRSLAIRL